MGCFFEFYSEETRKEYFSEVVKRRQELKNLFTRLYFATFCVCSQLQILPCTFPAILWHQLVILSSFQNSLLYFGSFLKSNFPSCFYSFSATGFGGWCQQHMLVWHSSHPFIFIIMAIIWIHFHFHFLCFQWLLFSIIFYIYIFSVTFFPSLSRVINIFYSPPFDLQIRYFVSIPYWHSN